MKIVIVGAGWAGCAAALSARKQGVEVTLIERTDMLLGTGLVGGIMRNNGRFTATEEMIALGGGELFELADANSLHRDLTFPGHLHASLYNVATMEPVVRKYLLQQGIDIRLGTRITDVQMSDRRIQGVTGKQGQNDMAEEGDIFIDATGTAGPQGNCNRHGNGCAMCILRCPSFGGRVSLAGKAGVPEMTGGKGEQTGAMSGSCKLFKESLAPSVRAVLDAQGVAVIPIPEETIQRGKLELKACQQYASAAFENNLILLDSGHAKLMTPFYPLEALRRVPGFENARYEDPYAGGLGNSMRYFDMAPRDNALAVEGVENLFCAGEKAGLLVGHTEAICTGTLAGYNAARSGQGKHPLILPETLAVGDAISHVRSRMIDEGERGTKFTFSGSVYFERMQQLGLYSTDTTEIARRVEQAGLSRIFSTGAP